MKEGVRLALSEVAAKLVAHIYDTISRCSIVAGFKILYQL